MRPSTEEEAEARVWRAGWGAGWPGLGPDGLVAWSPRSLDRAEDPVVRLDRVGRPGPWRGGAPPDDPRVRAGRWTSWLGVARGLSSQSEGRPGLCLGHDHGRVAWAAVRPGWRQREHPPAARSERTRPAAGRDYSRLRLRPLTLAGSTRVTITLLRLLFATRTTGPPRARLLRRDAVPCPA